MSLYSSIYKIISLIKYFWTRFGWRSSFQYIHLLCWTAEKPKNKKSHFIFRLVYNSFFWSLSQFIGWTRSGDFFILNIFNLVYSVEYVHWLVRFWYFTIWAGFVVNILPARIDNRHWSCVYFLGCPASVMHKQGFRGRDRISLWPSWSLALYMHYLRCQMSNQTTPSTHCTVCHIHNWIFWWLKC